MMQNHKPAIERERAVRRNNLSALIRHTSRELKTAIATGRSSSEIAVIKARRDMYFELHQALS